MTGRLAYCKKRKAWHALTQTRMGGGKRKSHYCPWRKDKAVAERDAITCKHIVGPTGEDRHAIDVNSVAARGPIDEHKDAASRAPEAPAIAVPPPSVAISLAPDNGAVGVAADRDEGDEPGIQSSGITCDRSRKDQYRCNIRHADGSCERSVRCATRAEAEALLAERSAGVPSSRIAKRSGNRRVYKHWRKVLQLPKLSFHAWQTEPLLRGIATPSDVSTSAKVQLDGKYGGTKRDRNLVARVTTKERQITSLQRDVAQYEAKIATLSAHHAVNWYDGLCLQPTGGDAIEHPSPRPGLPTAYSAEQVVRLRNQTLCVLLMLGKIVDEAKLDIAFNEAYLSAVRNAPTSSPTTREASTTRQEMAAAIVHDLSLTDKPSTIQEWLREYLELGGFKQDGRGKRKRDN